MNAVITSSSLKKLVMWNKVRELKSLSINDEAITLNKGVYEYNYTVKNEITSVDLKQN